MSYLQFDGFTLKNLCIARPNKGTCKASGWERAGATTPPRASTRRHRASIVHRRTTAGPKSLGMTSACIGLMRVPRSRLSWWSAAPCGKYARTAVSSPPCRARTQRLSLYPVYQRVGRLTAKQRCLCRASPINSRRCSSHV
jgi:hypothetical protein